jgi:hypothetical protein
MWHLQNWVATSGTGVSFFCYLFKRTVDRQSVSGSQHSILFIRGWRKPEVAESK